MKRSITEKKELISIYRCRREDRKDQIIAELQDLRQILTASLKAECKVHQDEIKRIEAEIEELLEEHQLNGIGRYSCGSNKHPKWQAFIKQGQDHEEKIWKGDI